MPFVDSYDLVVLKTVAICEYAVCSIRGGCNIVTLNLNYLSDSSYAISMFFLFIYTFSLKARVVSAKYVMKCDDDTFVRLDSVMAEIKKIPEDKSFYMGNMNYYHRPLREGKWAVSYEVK